MGRKDKKKKIVLLFVKYAEGGKVLWGYRIQGIFAGLFF